MLAGICCTCDQDTLLAGEKAGCVLPNRRPYTGIAILPVFVGGAITKREKLSDALRALKAALRVELRLAQRLILQARGRW